MVSRNSKKKIISEAEFHPKTIRYIEESSLDYRKSKGQYFTPRTIRDQLLSQLPNGRIGPKILDPACGTGEFLLSAATYFKEPQLYGWDIDEGLIDIAKGIVKFADIRKHDSLKIQTKERFDFIIGNPPYFEFKPEEEVRERFNEVINGRTNIFALFIKLGVDLLKDGGYLAYVVPPSMNNGAYFSRLRNYIVEHTNIEYLSIVEEAGLFHQALQSTMLFVVKKGKNKGDYLFRENGVLIFTEKPHYLKKAFQGRSTLKDLGYKVKTGRLVWNQNKHLLTHSCRKGIPLIWSKNITAKGLQIPLKGRPQFVLTNDYDIGPAVVVNRITGAVRSSQLRAAIIPENMKFVAENHVNVIYPPERIKQLELSDTQPKPKVDLQDIVKQLRSREKSKVIQYITGNTQVSSAELEKLFPVDI